MVHVLGSKPRSMIVTGINDDYVPDCTMSCKAMVYTLLYSLIFTAGPNYSYA